MSLSYDVISQFAKVVNKGKKQSTEATVYGTIIEENNTKYVQLDGSNQLTPLADVSSSISFVNASNNDRVMVLIKDHTATITGNLTSPSVNAGDVTVQIANNILEVQNGIDNASKTATNYLSYDSTNGCCV